MKRIWQLTLIASLLTQFIFAQSAVVVKEIRAGIFGGEPRFVVAMNNILYFSADNQTNGNELWRSDGTDAGTIMVKDIRPGSADSDPTNLAVSNGVLYFGANNGVNGWELWRSDGTTAGTSLVLDLAPDEDASLPEFITGMNSNIYFVATTEESGRELFRLVTGSLPVTWIDFTAAWEKNNTVQLQRKVAESQNSHFEVQHAINGNFTTVETISSKNGSGTSQYSYVHQQPGLGINYYRIRQVDADGNSTYSKTLSITGWSLDGNLKISPNPATGRSITLKYNRFTEESHIINLLSADGKIISRFTIPKQSSPVYNLSIEKLPKGIYYISLQGQQHKEIQQILID